MLQKAASGSRNSFPRTTGSLEASYPGENPECRSSLLPVVKSLIPWLRCITTKLRLGRTTGDRSCSAFFPEIFLVPKRLLRRPDYRLALLPDRGQPVLKLGVLPRFS